jgi:SAM-dependent methyltransferase
MPPVLRYTLLSLLVLSGCRSAPRISYEDVNKLELLKKIAKTRDDISYYYKYDVHRLDLKPRQVIADIGAFDGIWDGIYSVFTDSLTFYIEDITNAGFARSDSIMDYCAKLKGRDPHAQVIKVLGTDSSTQLPSSTFDKVICNESFHHFGKPEKMLADIRRILKPGGRLYIRDSLRKRRTHQQNHFHYTLREMKEIIKRSGFKVSEDHSTRKMAFLVLESAYAL